MPRLNGVYRESTMSIYRRGGKEWDYAGYVSSFVYSSLLKRPIAIANVGPSIDYLEEAFADCLAGRYSRRPFPDCCVQSTIDPDMTPPGKHIMSCFVMYAPYHLAKSNWDDERENLGDVVQATLEKFFPGFANLILHREVVTPLDMERLRDRRPRETGGTSDPW